MVKSSLSFSRLIYLEIDFWIWNMQKDFVSRLRPHPTKHLEIRTGGFPSPTGEGRQPGRYSKTSGGEVENLAEVFFILVPDFFETFLGICDFEDTMRMRLFRAIIFFQWPQ